MAKINPEIESFARIKVIGIGGSGKNALNHMISSKVKGVEFIVMNTDTQDLHNSFAEKKVHLGKNLTKGLGAGMNPEIGRRAAEETKAEIQDVIKGADMVFIACGIDGGIVSDCGICPVNIIVDRARNTNDRNLVLFPKSMGSAKRAIAANGNESVDFFRFHLCRRLCPHFGLYKVGRATGFQNCSAALDRVGDGAQLQRLELPR
jgi:cell division protein FtsZ